MRGHLDLEDEQRDPQRQQQQADHVHRKVAERQGEQQQAEDADDPGQDQPRMRQLDVEPEDPDAEKDHHQLRLQQRPEQPLHERSLEGLADGSGRVQDRLGTVKTADLPSVQLREQLGPVARDQVDQSFPESLRLREGDRFDHGLLGEIDIAPAVLGDRPGEGRQIGLRLLETDVVLGARAGDLHRVSRPGVRSRRHGGRVGGDQQKEAGRGGAGPARRDIDDDRRLGPEHPLRDLLGRFDQAPRSVDLDDEG